MNIEPTRVFEAVDINKELPKDWDCYTVQICKKLNGCTSLYTKFIDYNPLNGVWGGLEKHETITHWLKETTNKYLLSKEELEKIIYDAKCEGYSEGQNEAIKEIHKNYKPI